MRPALQITHRCWEVRIERSPQQPPSNPRRTGALFLGALLTVALSSSGCPSEIGQIAVGDGNTQQQEVSRP